MPDPFTPCPARNSDDVPCWLVAHHRSVHEVHPFHRKRTKQPVWSTILAGGTFTEDAITYWRRTTGTDPITGELA